MNDVDVKGTMARTDYESMCQPLLERAMQPLKQALSNAGMIKECNIEHFC